MTKEFEIIKSTGIRAPFSLEKLQESLRRSGADKRLIDHIVKQVSDELYDGITTREIYNRAFALLKKDTSVYASKYKLKKAIYELGPTGFPFEKFIAAILIYSGHSASTNVVVEGSCVDHEIDVIANKGARKLLIECKFHSDKGKKCNVKVPLYINSRLRDIAGHPKHKNFDIGNGWVVTNTRFTRDAIKYGKCAGLYLLSWDFPEKHSLRERIDRLGLYPITVSTILSNREKQFLLSRNIVLCRQLLKDSFFLDHLGVSEARKKRILKEVETLCAT
ncbi:restriction endonuclease [Muriicola sp. Z0-33]|uniref:restriction endonuclease n=1 Tax=Muriicola sp. Z0-33 TaxID=2816957 RepID=UPI00223874E5|nr:ATP cone domain-containing protein [Muriicola sp. Z0-33]MCW5515763.1 restriction endonuclease [Muriicola sp. Z0-33]